MKILKGNFFVRRTCEFGNFELRPDDGWKISQQFIDYESKLLYVSMSDLDENNWADLGAGTRSVPNKRYIIDPIARRIIPPDEWSKYFSYEPKEVISPDGKFKLITTRIHDAAKNSDSIDEQMIHLESGSIYTSQSVAFGKEKRENMLESMYRSQREWQERASHIARMPTLESSHERERALLKAGDVILAYYNADHIFRLTYMDSKFKFESWEAKWRANFNFSEVNASFLIYDDLEDYVMDFLNTKNFYLDHQVVYSVSTKRSRIVLKKFVVSFMNELRRHHNFSYEEYRKLNEWENVFYENDAVKPSEYKQYCANCAKIVSYTPRYPKHICRECAAKKIVDENGVELDFANVGFSGGLKVIYKDGDRVLKEDSTQFEKRCFIDGKEFVATEARFGGIVIQTAE